MPRIQLAHWHGTHAPGDEIDVSDEEFAALTRDGRVAGTVTEPAPATEPAVEQDAQPVEASRRKGR